MDIFQLIRDNEEEIINRWYKYLTTSESQRYASFSFEEIRPRMEKNFYNISRCEGGKLTEDAKQFIYDLAQERMSQDYNYWELLTFFRTMRRTISEFLYPFIVNDVSQYEKTILVFEEAYQKLSEGYLDYQISVIEALHRNLLELSTPVIPIDDQILVMPLIGTIDTFRANQIMEAILHEVTAHQAEVVIIDITGVPIVDTAVANHLMRTVKAVKLVGGQCVLVGVRPEIAQTIVRLDLAFPNLTTAATLKKGLVLARQILSK